MRHYGALRCDALDGRSPLALAFDHVALPALALDCFALRGQLAYAFTLLLVWALLLDDLAIAQLPLFAVMLLASLVFTCMFGTHLRPSLLRDQFPCQHVLPRLLGAASGLLAVYLGPPLDRDIGLCLALVLLGLLARVFALLLPVEPVLLLLLRCHWLARERRRCGDPERERRADHGGQHGTVDGVVDVHGGPRVPANKRLLPGTHYTRNPLNTI